MEAPCNSTNDNVCAHPSEEDLFGQAEDATRQCEQTVRNAISRVKTDEKPNAAMEPETIEALAQIEATNAALFAELRHELKGLQRFGVLVGTVEKHIRQAAGELGLAPEVADEKAIADQLVEAVLGVAEVFVDLEGESHLTLHEAPRKTLLLQSKAAREWLSWLCFDILQRSASDAVLGTAVTTLSGIARHAGAEETPVYLRAAPSPDGNGYLIDLCDDDWRAVHVTASSWYIVEEPPVRFRRSQTMRPLPTPKRGGDLSALWQYVNIPEILRAMVLAVLLEAWRPETPFLVLELIGGQGKGKSDTQERFRFLIDPNAVPLRSLPKDVEAIHVAANASWLISYNNLSRLSAAMQDAFCNLATGGGYAGRALYTNKDESLIESKRPVMLNGINPVVTAQDLIDRVIRIELPAITKRRRAAELRAGFERDYPAIFGGLLDLFSRVLAILPSVAIEDPPRMADFAHLGQAVYQALGNPRDFCEHYAEVRQGAIAAGLESSPAAKAILELAQDRGGYAGTVKKLLDSLTTSYKHESTDGWPKSARGLTEILRRQEHALSTFGVKVFVDPVRKRDGYHVVIEYVSSPARGTGRKDVHNAHNVHEASNGAGFRNEPRVNVGGNGEHSNVHASGDVHTNVHCANPRGCGAGEDDEHGERLSGASTSPEKEDIPSPVAEYREGEL